MWLEILWIRIEDEAELLQDLDVGIDKRKRSVGVWEFGKSKVIR